MNISIQNITDTSFVVQWDTVIDHSDVSYIVALTKNETFHLIMQNVTLTDTSYTVTGLTPNTTYRINVTGVNKFCENPVAFSTAETKTFTSIFPDTNPTDTTTVTTSPPDATSKHDCMYANATSKFSVYMYMF